MITDWLKTYALAIATAGAVASLVGIGVQQLRVSYWHSEYIKLGGAWARQSAAAEESARITSENYRREEARRNQATQEAIAHAEHIATQARADLAIADAAAGRLRQRIAALVAASRQAASAPAVAEGSPPAASPADMLADVLGRCVARVVELGGYADAAHNAGTTCERISDQVRD